MKDVLVLGAGVIGMLTARELSARGCSVLLLDRGRCAQEASWAGGGIVSPLYPWRYSDAVTALAVQAQQAYPALCQALLAETGLDPELEPCGLLMLEAADADEALAWSARTGSRMQAVDNAFIQQQVPHLAHGYSRALWMPTIANVRNPRLCQALRRSLELDPRVEIREAAEVAGFEYSAGQVAAVRLADTDERLAAGHFVLCAGAWTGQLLRELQLSLAVEPVKGQMLLFRPTRPLLSTMVLYKGRYLIPRRDGHLLVGSTLEHQGFDKTSTEEAMISLQASAAGMIPELGHMVPERQWAGLRPGAPEGVPFIGRLPGFGNLHVNAGHYRNGLVLAPASSRLLAELLVAGSAPGLDPQPYAPAERMVSSPEAASQSSPSFFMR